MEYKVGDNITWNTMSGPVTAQICEISEEGYRVTVGAGKVVLVARECVKNY